MLTLRQIDKATLAGGRHNEDRVGHHGQYAWIMDGATDVLKTRILPGGSDAGWFAGTLNDTIKRFVMASSPPLDELAFSVAADIRAEFDRAALRPIEHHHEHPSAAGIIVRTSGNQLEFLSLGDCTLLLIRNGRAADDVINPQAARGADPHVVKIVKKLQNEPRGEEIGAIRANLIPHLRLIRDHLNQPNGYGVFSIIQPPAKFIKQGQIITEPGDTFCLATDGFMRLVDVFGSYNLATLSKALQTTPLASLLAELREIEQDDASCKRFPRAKKSDDATAIIFEVIET